MQNQELKSVTVQEILRKCPAPVISRREAAKLTGGLMCERYLANLDSAGKGPVERVRMGRRVGYTSSSFARWLAGRIESKFE